MPDATLRALRSRRGLAIWSEMISDGVMALELGGALDRQRPIVCSFMFGGRDLYRWADRNPRVQMAATPNRRKGPAQIAARPSMVSINTALQLDLHDQAGASHVGNRVYSGLGGQLDFVEGALRSHGGQAVIAMRSWHEKKTNSSTYRAAASDPRHLPSAFRGRDRAGVREPLRAGATAPRRDCSSRTRRIPTRASGCASTPAPAGSCPTSPPRRRAAEQPSGDGFSAIPSSCRRHAQGFLRMATMPGPDEAPRAAT